MENEEKELEKEEIREITTGKFDVDIEDLIGRKIIRTKPIPVLKEGNRIVPDWSYTTEPVELIGVSESHLTIKSEEMEMKLLRLRWDDGNWRNYEKV